MVPCVIAGHAFVFGSGITSSAGEQCVVTGTAGIHLEPCLEAIAAGDGRKVMQFDKEGFSCMLRLCVIAWQFAPGWTDGKRGRRHLCDAR